jgi:hypothetical protein
MMLNTLRIRDNSGESSKAIKKQRWEKSEENG